MLAFIIQPTPIKRSESDRDRVSRKVQQNSFKYSAREHRNNAPHTLDKLWKMIFDRVLRNAYYHNVTGRHPVDEIEIRDSLTPYPSFCDDYEE